MRAGWYNRPIMNQAYQSLALARWLFACCGLVFLMVMIGAITRLTESGLSITEWRPVTGALPPLSNDEWERIFALYKQSPEFLKKNAWMQLADFKTIFFWEWLHRLLGRLIGLAYALPLLWFWMTNRIPQGYKAKLLGVFILGGLQGALGWYMVQSGLIDQPAVSHYRLAAHLALAFLIFGAMLWLGLSLRNRENNRGHAVLFVHGLVTLAFLATTIVWGAFTAGLDAGLIYNDSFPKMGGAWLPPDLWHLDPAWLNFFENHAGVQFTHRWLAMGTLAMIAGFWSHGVMKKNTFPAFHMLMATGALQLSLGIVTLLSHVWLPAAVLHQAGALTTFGLLLACLHRLRPGASHRP